MHRGMGLDLDRIDQPLELRLLNPNVVFLQVVAVRQHDPPHIRSFIAHLEDESGVARQDLVLRMEFHDCLADQGVHWEGVRSQLKDLQQRLGIQDEASAVCASVTTWFVVKAPVPLDVQAPVRSQGRPPDDEVIHLEGHVTDTGSPLGGHGSGRVPITTKDRGTRCDPELP